MKEKRKYFPNMEVETSKGTMEITTSGTCYLRTEKGSTKLNSVMSSKISAIYVDLLGTPTTIKLEKSGEIIVIEQEIKIENTGT